jgi:mannitol-1-phosphate 5-dehydrogenase
MADQNILIFGAGKIGRSFIGQLFGRAGYRVVFVDMDRPLVDTLNHRRNYTVVIKGPEKEERWTIGNVRAIHALDVPKVTEAIRMADIMAISVGKNALPAVADVVAEGLLEREKTRPGVILDIILAENMRSADLFLRKKLRDLLPGSYPLDQLVGLVETSIGKMVPIMTEKDLEADPLQVFAEPYNTLILDRKGFRGKIPDIPGFALKDNMKAWVDRKAFIHNLGHATAAYFGYLKHPDATFMYQVLEDTDIYKFTREVMLESSVVLMSMYPGEFTPKALSAHIDDLLSRFRNRNLGDTVFRVGCDLKRKLGSDDRFMAVIRSALEHKQPHDRILKAMAMGFLFSATDEKGQVLTEDAVFHQEFRKDPDRMFDKVCGLRVPEDENLISQLKLLIEEAN